MLSSNTVKRLMHALTSRTAGLEMANALDAASAANAQDGMHIAAAIVASHASATTDFAALAVGDKVIHIAAGAAPANVNWASVITAGTNPDGAGVIGDLYIALRAPAAAPASRTDKL
jgi:hypothetical protein